MPVIILNWRRLNWRLVSISTVVFTIFFNEYLVYSLQSWRWLSFPIPQQREKDVVVLLVADPQLQGYQREPPSVIGALSRWDADRYLRNNFKMACGYVRPDVVVFLGDLLDEGSTATDREFADYTARFHSIFSTPDDVKKIHLSGDNDIGGEGGDFRSKPKMERFIRHFEDLTGSVRVKFVDFIKMDVEFHNGLTPNKLETATRLRSQMTGLYRVLLNHAAILPKLKGHIHPLLTRLRPHLILSAHYHKSSQYVCDDCMSHKSDISMEHWPVHRRDLTAVDRLIEVDLDDKDGISEFMIPSCSYRMGEKNSGYGVLVIKDSGTAYHGVLWLPQRYKLLFIYLLVALTLGLFPLVRPYMQKRLTR